MNLVWHIVKKDLRRMAVPLALWSALLVAKGEIGVALLNGDGADLVLFDTLRLVSNILLGADIFVHVMLVAVLVQEDALVGTRMFWTTRPIGGGRMMAAKLAGAGLMFGVLPILISLRWWLACGDGGSEIARSALVTLDQQMFTTVGAMVLATLTANVNQFIGWGIGAAVAICAWLFTAREVLGFGRRFNPEATGTKMAVLSLLMVAGATAVVVGQFRTRRRGRSVGFAVGAVFVASFIFFRWSWDWSALRSKPEKNSPAAAAVTVSVDWVELTAPTEQNWAEGKIGLRYVIHRIPENLGVVVAWTHELGWVGGPVLNRDDGEEIIEPRLGEWLALGLPPGEFNGFIHRPFWMLSKKITAEALSNEHVAEGVLDTRTFFRRAAADRILEDPPRLLARLKLQFIEPVREMELPVRAGEVGARDGYRVRISSVVTHDDKVFVHGVESRPATRGGNVLRFGFAALLCGAASEKEEEVRHVLVNRARGEERGYYVSESVVATIGTKTVRWWQTSETSPEWMEQATLNLLRYRKGEQFQRVVTIEKLIVNPGEKSP